MASKKVAVRPDFINSIPSLKRDEKAQKAGATDEERFLYGMSQTAGFPIFTQKKDALLNDFVALQEVAIAQGKSLEEIGQNAIVINAVRGIVNRLWSFVEDSKEACESSGGK